MSNRSGIGYDVHRLVAGGPLVLCGVTIPHSHRLEGHSDADVATHAVIDAMLGAVALGDLGTHFPPGDPAFAGIASLVLLERARELVGERAARVVHVDVTVIAEAPRLAPHVGAMREQLARTLGVELEAISIKATTHEGLGPLGRGEGIAALAVVTVDVTG
jgi:2-C-methyl-D-erythritol 4-phosphate cytidylyltransferase/2-C-methyl-D-erythritol 2,4-cyclodiphosphate synthase